MGGGGAIEKWTKKAESGMNGAGAGAGAGRPLATV